MSNDKFAKFAFGLHCKYAKITDLQAFAQDAIKKLTGQLQDDQAALQMQKVLFDVIEALKQQGKDRINQIEFSDIFNPIYWRYFKNIVLSKQYALQLNKVKEIVNGGSFEYLFEYVLPEIQ